MGSSQFFADTAWSLSAVLSQDGYENKITGEHALFVFSNMVQFFLQLGRCEDAEFEV